MASLSLASLALAAAVLGSGCYDHATLMGAAASTTLGVIANGPHPHPVNLQATTTDGGRSTVRLAPSTGIRFQFADGSQSGWTRVGDVVASPLGIQVLAVTGGPQGGAVAPGGSPAATVPCGDGLSCLRTLVPWSQVGGVELRNFDGPETLMGMIFGAVIVVAVVVMDEKSGGGNVGDVAVNAVDTVANVAINTAANVAVAQAAAQDAAPPPQVVLDETMPGTVFTPNASRRSTIQLLLSEQAGVLSSAGGVDLVGVGLELDDLLDVEAIGLGLDPGLAPAGFGGRAGVTRTGFGVRTALDLPIDPGRHVFLPVGVDYATIEGGGSFLALDAELDVRLRGDVRLGLRPFNPAYLSAGGVGRGGYLSELTLQLGF